MQLEVEFEPEKQSLLAERRTDMVVGEADIAELVSKWTGIPAGKLLGAESERLINMADELHQRVIGQEESAVAVSEAIRRSRSWPVPPSCRSDRCPVALPGRP